MGKIIDFKTNTERLRDKIKELAKDKGDKKLLNLIDKTTEEELDKIVSKTNNKILLLQKKMREIDTELQHFIKEMQERYDTILVINVILDYINEMVMNIEQETPYQDVYDSFYQKLFNTEMKRVVLSAVKEVIGYETDKDVSKE